jgi:hypothetical protein
MRFTLSRKTSHLKNDASNREEEHEGERGNSNFMGTFVLQKKSKKTMDIMSENEFPAAHLPNESRPEYDEEEEEEEKTEVLEEKGCIVPPYSAENDEVSREIPSVITARRLFQPLDDVFEYPRQYRSEHRNTTSPKESVSSWWKWIVVALIVLLLVLVVTMLVSVLYWLRQDRSDANNVATVLVEGGENHYGPILSSSPSSSPTTEPSISAGASKTNFLPLANHPDSTFLAMVSSCDDCEEYVELPFEFAWLGKLPLTSISVSSNGAILVGSNNLFGQCCGIINVVAADLDPSSSQGGGIWTLSIPGAAYAARAQEQQQRQSTSVEAFRVSWENVPFLE